MKICWIAEFIEYVRSNSQPNRDSKHIEQRDDRPTERASLDARQPPNGLELACE
jgi:hypothetical protein